MLFIVILVLIFFLVFLSALVSSSETALFAVTSSEKAALKSSPSRRDKQIMQLLDNPRHILAAIIVANNFFNLSIIILSAFLTGELINIYSHPILTFIIEVVFVTLLLLLICDIIPKAYSSANPLRVINKLLFFILFIRASFYPFASVLTLSTSFLDRYVFRKKEAISPGDLSEALDIIGTEATTGEHISKGQQKILKDILQLGNKDVKEIMQPRIDIMTFESSIKFGLLLKKAVESGFSRLPVYQSTPDNMTGILYTKDLLAHTNEPDSYEWQKLLHKPFFVPESKKISDLLEDFQEKKIHLAVVVDEFGSTSGIVTMEDIVEEILGEINDEFDEEKVIYSKLDENNYVFEGKVSLGDFCRTINIDESLFQSQKGGAETLAGFIIELKGRIPVKNEKLEFGNLLFTIEVSDKRTIQRVRVTLLSDS